MRIASVEELPGKSGNLVCDVRDVDLHLNFQPAASDAADTLVISFHGAVDRPNRSIPAFVPFLPDIGDDVHQLAVADPSLRTGPEIGLSWFAGDIDFDAQRLLPTLFQSIASNLGVRRTIYFGTSGGGFAALYYSRKHSGSLALVGNPQTNITRYYAQHIDRYLSNCWPGVTSIAALAGKAVTNLSDVYSAGEIGNHVVYLQNSTDAFHLFGQMAPFFASIRSAASRERIGSACIFPGKSGHSPMWAMLSPWLRAAIMAPDWMAKTIITTHHALTANSHGTSGTATSARNATAAAEAQSKLDLQMAALLRDYHLREPIRG